MGGRRGMRVLVEWCVYDRELHLAIRRQRQICIRDGANVGKVPLLRNATRAALLGARGVHAVSLPWDEWARAEDLGECDAMLADVVGRFRE